MKKRTYMLLPVIILVLFLGYFGIIKAYYKISEPIFLEHHFYVSTELEEFEISLNYLTNRNSNLKINRIKVPEDLKIQIELLEDHREPYSKYYELNTLVIKVISLEPGETEINKLTIEYSDFTEQEVSIGSLLFNFRELIRENNEVRISASGGSGSNTGFNEYEVNSNLTLTKVNYDLRRVNEDILKIVFMDEYKNYNTILESNEFYELETIQNRELDIQLTPDKKLALVGYFDFAEESALKDSRYYIFIDVIFIDENNEEVLSYFNSSYLPCLKANEIRALGKSSN